MGRIDRVPQVNPFAKAPCEARLGQQGDLIWPGEDFDGTFSVTLTNMKFNSLASHDYEWEMEK